MFALGSAMALLAGLRSRRVQTLPTWAFAIGAVPAALHVMIKFSVGAFLTGLLVIAVVASPQRIRSAVYASSSFILSIVIGWVGSGQRPTDLTRWFAKSVDIANGYSSAMAIRPTRLGFVVGAAVPLFFALGDIVALWTYGLRWKPIPTMQSYVANSPALDNANASALTSRNGPQSILVTSGSIDGRNQAWDSPAYQIALRCNFREAATSERWTALIRSTDRCRAMRRLGEVIVHGGETIDVPRAATPGAIVVATFGLTSSSLDHGLDSIFRPIRLPYAVTRNNRFRFTLATAGQPHILHDLDGRALGQTHESESGETLRFEKVGGPIVVSFFEIPLLH